MCCVRFVTCRPIATRSFTHARQTAEPDAGDQPLHRVQSLPGSAETDDYEEGKQSQRLTLTFSAISDGQTDSNTLCGLIDHNSLLKCCANNAIASH